MMVDTGSFRDEMGQILSEIIHKCGMPLQTLLDRNRHLCLPEEDRLPKSPDTDNFKIADLTVLNVMDFLEEGGSENVHFLFRGMGQRAISVV